MEANGPGNTVDEDGIGHGKGDDVGEVEFEEIGFAQDGLVGEVADTDEQQEDPGDEIEKRAEEAVPNHGGMRPAG